MRHTLTKMLFAVLMLGASGAACAHPGHGVSGFAAGLAHPFTGLDHLLAMVAVGIWAVQGGGRRVWLLPATFMTMLVAGAALALQWQGLRMVEVGIAASVLALGLLVSLSMRLPAILSVGITALFGLLHGYAHGLELPSSAHPAAFALGFLIATAFLHGSGIALSKRYAVLAKALGVGIAACGGYLLVAA
ncbi:MAG TPA: HupE/UreJ family protein [Gallionellaceae bacterium]|nr:HupE/UreJ family protein [Gallionellaceae bacterium]